MLEKIKTYNTMNLDQKKAYWYQYSSSLETLLIQEEEILSLDQKIEISAEIVRVFQIIKDLLEGKETINNTTNSFINENYRKQTRSLWSVTSQEHKNLLHSIKQRANEYGDK